MTVDPFVWMFGVYGLVLVGVGWAFDLLARRTGSQAQRWRQGGFTYHESHDAWLCPEDQWLWPTSFDEDNRVMRYRAKPSVCNSCPVKDTCTTSDHGRSMTRQVDPWPHSETGRFHRGLALAVACMGLILVLAAVLAYHRPAEIAVLAAFAIVITAATFPLAVFLWQTPSNFPTYLPVATGTEDVLISKKDRFQTVYASSRRSQSRAGDRYRPAYASSKRDRTAGGTTYDRRTR